MDPEHLIVLDFETSGLSPAQGGRPIEIGAVLLQGGRVVDRFQSLMDPGFRVSAFIQDYTGITNAMLAHAPPCREVMARFARFIEGHPLAAHNASFDRGFLDAELQRLGLAPTAAFACTMLAARRVYPAAPNHKLGTLAQHLGLPWSGQAHRALGDAGMAAALWQRMVADLQADHGLPAVPFDMMVRLGKVPKRKVAAFLAAEAWG